jgi:hypothetical protein
VVTTALFLTTILVVVIYLGRQQPHQAHVAHVAHERHSLGAEPLPQE